MTTEQTGERIVSDVRQGMVDAAAVLKATAGQAGAVLDELRATVTSTDRTIRANPYGAMGLAFAAGMLLGVLVNRK